MEILKGINIIDLGLQIGETLIIADLHIGYEEALNKQGVMVPRFQLEDVLARLDKIIKKANPKTIVVNGDIKHEFGRISEQEWRETLRVIDFLLERSKKLVLVKGNHDTVLGPIAEKRGVEVREEYEIREKGVLIIHGHKMVSIPARVKTIIIGHEHPAVSLRDGARAETFKCFLRGKYDRKNLIAMPSFNLVAEGTDALKEELLSPFLQQDITCFEVFVISDRAYDFGKLRNLL